jgi:hypothetical protein
LKITYRFWYNGNMPTVIVQDGFELVVRSNDHEPPHAHVFKGGQTCRVAIGEPGIEPPWHFPWKNPSKTTLRQKEIARAIVLIGQHQDALCAKWKEITHG